MVRMDRDPLISYDDINIEPSSDVEELNRGPSAPVHNSLILLLSIQGVVIGLLTTFIGLVEVFWLPFLCNSGNAKIVLRPEVFCGFTMWCGIMLTITSSTGLRTTITKRQSTVNRYLAFQILTSVVYCFAFVVVIVDMAYVSTLQIQDGCNLTGYVLGSTFIGISALFHISTFSVTCVTIFKDKPMTLFRYIAEAVSEHCLPQNPRTGSVQDEQ
ncbi:uncharacterized protein [Watersipora subatra]|uniref:uncharacterized protein n=1 Tax=Watersipora subatra TaxID=2589382 RepID=UPI00355AFE77